MFLLDNQVVRADYKAAKTVVLDVLKKHGGQVVTARRWDERRLAYPIKGRLRATYILTHFEAGPDAITGIRHDAELDERILRYLFLAVEGVPPTEIELSAAEGDDFAPPPPPADDAVDREESVEGGLPTQDGDIPEEDSVGEDGPVNLDDEEDA